jgi:hypothetical protein
MQVLGLDIGGANLKAAHAAGAARLQPFALWKDPAALPAALAALVQAMPAFDGLAVTMTGELCDCFESKRQGVAAILDAVAAVARGKPVQVWQWARDARKRPLGRFVDIPTARATPLQTAAANWLALATFAGRFAREGSGLLIDIGSTTTDIVPLDKGRPVPQGLTDPERLRSSELVYTGVRRTPVCALRSDVAAELFATTLDVYLVLGRLPEDPADHDTADGRPATQAAAHARLARMLGADLETCTEKERRTLAQFATMRQVYLLGSALERVAKRLSAPPRTLVAAGSGEFLIPALLESQQAFSAIQVVSLADRLGPAISQAACAYALAMLATERAGNRTTTA